MIRRLIRRWKVRRFKRAYERLALPIPGVYTILYRDLPEAVAILVVADWRVDMIRRDLDHVRRAMEADYPSIQFHFTIMPYERYADLLI